MEHHAFEEEFGKIAISKQIHKRIVYHDEEYIFWLENELSKAREKLAVKSPRHLCMTRKGECDYRKCFEIYQEYAKEIRNSRATLSFTVWLERKMD